MPRLRDESRNNPNNKRALNFIERVTSKADVVQKQVLSSILSRNAHTEYLIRHGLQGATDRATFKEKVPIVTYEDIEPYIRRIANGDTSPVLCSEPISEFLTSSGTSGGESKLMPTIDEEMGRRRLLYKLLMPVMDQYVKGLEKGKAMNLLFVKSEKRTPGGLLARPVLTSYYKSKHFKEAPYDPYNVLTSPKEAILCQDHFQSMYAQLLCGLLQNKEVLRVGAVFASGFIRAIHFLQEHWPSLCHDIATGTVSTVVKDPSVREGVQKILKGPNKKLALAIQQECCKDSWKGIITRIWPNTKYIDVIVTGAMAQYIHTLQFYGNNLPLVCTMYASSECYFGLNLNPLTPPSNVSYTILPNMAYFEFLPVTHGDDSPTQQPVDLVDVKVGQEYELVVTTYAGLCRYRVGDVLRVTGFHNKAPQFHFICRKNVGLSIDVDKTDEAELHKAVENAVKNLEPFGVKLLEYTSYADTSTVPGHYVLFWEMDTGEGTVEVPASVFEDCCLTLEESLSSVYKNCRAEKSVGPLEIRVVAQRAFDELMDYALSKGASINQYKAPRCVNSGPIVDLFQSKVINSYFSPKAPKRVNF